MSNQPLVSPVEVEALRFKLVAVEKELEAQKVYYEAQIKELTRQRDSLQKQVNDFNSSRPRPKVITKKPG